VEAAVVLAAGPVITAEELDLPRGEAERFVPSGTLAEVEAAYIRHVLERCGGNRSEAARVLGIARNTLARKLGGDEP
jgi:DNA-binding NtrC family response regulator